MRKQVFLYGLLSIVISFSYAQTDVDALRYSTPSAVGTARNAALGNTMGTIGADISSISTNPAGLAKFSSTEFTISPAIVINKTNSTYLGGSMSNSKVKFQLTNFGIAVASRYASSENKKWNGIKFGFALNKLADYNGEYFFGGYNAKNSLLNSYYEKLADKSVVQSPADASSKYPFDASIAYQLGLLTADSLGNFYTATNNGNMQQDFVIRKTGGMNELALGIASEYKEKFMIGASLGIPIVNYTEDILLKETDTRDSAYVLNSFSNETYLKTRGVGINFKIGVIVTPVKNLRLSLAVQTPGILFMHDQYITHMEADFDTLSVILTGDSPNGDFKYKYVQPWKMTAGVGYIHKYGLISVEYELSSAGSSKFKLGSSNTDVKAYESYVNSQIDSKYGIFHTIKAGVEFKYDPIRIRLGIQYRTSPFKKDEEPSGISTSALTYSGGIGYRGKHFFADLTYVQTNFKELFVPYQLSTPGWNPVPTASLSTKKPAIILTLGYKL